MMKEQIRKELLCMRITEENFVSRLRAKDEQAMTYVIETYGWIIKTVIKKHLYNFTHYEEECINDILLAVWQHSERFNPDKSTFKNWLAGVSKYTALNYVRKYKHEKEQLAIEEAVLEESDLTYETAVKDELSKDFEALLGTMKEKDRELFIKLYIEEHSIAEISRTTGMSREVIYNRLSRAKNKIRKLFS